MLSHHCRSSSLSFLTQRLAKRGDLGAPNLTQTMRGGRTSLMHCRRGRNSEEGSRGFGRVGCVFSLLLLFVGVCYFGGPAREGVHQKRPMRTLSQISTIPPLSTPRRGLSFPPPSLPSHFGLCYLFATASPPFYPFLPLPSLLSR